MNFFQIVTWFRSVSSRHFVHHHRQTIEDEQTATMSQFRSKRLDIAGFINARVIRDHTKRKVYEQFEPQRYVQRISRESVSMAENQSLTSNTCGLQPSTSLRGSEHLSARPCPRPGPAGTVAIARLYPVDADQEPMRCGRDCTVRFPRLQTGKGEFVIFGIPDLGWVVFGC